MILNLYIENIAVIEKTSVGFSEGFNVMTGETGAGKSIIIDSINLILGQRAPKDIIRTGEKKAFVSATFSGLTDKAKSTLKDLGYELDDEILIVQREINVNGNGFCKINSRPATVSILKKLGSYLINIHGQHESVGLLSPQTHIEYIDSMGNLENQLSDYRKEFNKLRKIKSELDKNSMDESEKSRKIDLLKYQIDEIKSVSPHENEDEELKEQRNIYSNSQKIVSLLSDAKNLINGKYDDIGALQMLETAAEDIYNVSSFMPDAEKLQSRMYGLVYELDDCLSEITAISDKIEFDQDKLQKIECRLDSLYRLTSKYGKNINEVLKYLENAKNELDDIELSDEKLKKLTCMFRESKSNAIKLANDLSNKRKVTSDQFCERIRNELEFLSMKGVKFHVSCKRGNLTSNGFDELEFLISTNPGEPPKPISKIASGGELSRIMLAVKNVIAQKDTVGTLIFDEIDTGISGAVSEKVGLKLKEVSRKRQVICVTHSAQIASLADEHFLIEKHIKNGGTYTNVRLLDYNERKNEIARIISGEKITDVTLANASEMLEIGKSKSI